MMIVMKYMKNNFIKYLTNKQSNPKTYLQSHTIKDDGSPPPLKVYLPFHFYFVIIQV